MFPLKEEVIVQKIIDFLCGKERGNWQIKTLKPHENHQHGPDIDIRGGKSKTEHFIIECKGKSYAKSANSINKEGWLVALGQLVTRMEDPRIIQSGKNLGEPNRAVKYGLGLYWIGAKVALKRIPFEIAKTMNLYIFSVDDEGFVKQFSPKDFKRDSISDEEFHK